MAPYKYTIVNLKQNDKRRNTIKTLKSHNRRISSFATKHYSHNNFPLVNMYPYVVNVS